MKYIKLFEGFVHLDSKSGIIQGVYDFVISNYSDELLNIFDLFQDCEDEGLLLGISVVYVVEKLGGTDRTDVNLFDLDRNLKSIHGLEDKWFKTRLIGDGFHSDFLDVVLRITKRGNEINTISYHDRVNPIIMEYVDRVKSTCEMELDKESHSGFPNNPDIYIQYKFFFRFL